MYKIEQRYKETGKILRRYKYETLKTFLQWCRRRQAENKIYHWAFLKIYKWENDSWREMSSAEIDQLYADQGK